MGIGYGGGSNPPFPQKCGTPKAARALCLPALGLSGIYLALTLTALLFRQPIMRLFTSDSEVLSSMVFPFSQVFCGIVLLACTGVSSGLMVSRSLPGGWTRQNAKTPTVLCVVALGAVAILSRFLPVSETMLHAQMGTSSLAAYSILSNIFSWIGPLQSVALLLSLIAGAITWYQATQDFGDYRWR